MQDSDSPTHRLSGDHGQRSREIPPAPAADLHAHTTLKPYLFADSPWGEARSPRGFSPFARRTGFPALLRGGLQIVCVAHHVPEEALFRDSLAVRAAARLLSPMYPWLRAGRPYRRLEELLDVLEFEAERAHGRLEVARGPGDLRRIVASGKLALVHAVEGGHVLEGDPSRVAELAARGVAMMGLAHLYPNGLVAGVDAVPDYPLVRAVSHPRFPSDDAPPLTDAGREAVDEMAAAGMLVDVTHAAPEARQEMLGRVGGRAPVVASHVGLRSLHDRPYNLGDDEVREIARTGGLVGIILMPYWLTGRSADGLEAVWRTARHIHRVTGSWRHVAIGSDLDGFTRPPDEVPDAGHFPRIARLFRERGLAAGDVHRVMFGNAERVLGRAWERVVRADRPSPARGSRRVADDTDRDGRRGRSVDCGEADGPGN